MNSIVFSLIFLVASAYADSPPNTKTSGGRYQLIQLSTFARDQYLLDTQTGKIWQKRCMIPGAGNECEYITWMVEEIEGINTDKKTIYKNVKEVEQFIKKKKEDQGS
jgi:hypothetical protein